MVVMVTVVAEYTALKIIASHLRLCYFECMQKVDRKGLQSILREAGFRATPGKIAVLEVLSNTDQPLTIADIGKELASKLDQTTLYRTVESFVEKKLVRDLHFNDRSIRYELLLGADHHHHVICKKCNYVEHVDVCGPHFEKRALVQSKSFTTIESHAVELFGTCNTCLKKK